MEADSMAVEALAATIMDAVLLMSRSFPGSIIQELLLGFITLAVASHISSIVRKT